jgi:adenosylcobinamide amidohydrolase
LNSGTNDLYKSVFNQHLSQEKIDYLVDHDVCEYLINECNNLGIDSEFATGLVTLAEMKNVSIVTKAFKGTEVTAVVTAGVRTNATRAGDPSSYWEENGEFHFGTINIILLTNVCLDKSTLLEAFMTATEAKTVALNDLRIPSQYSNGFATGTGTDGLAIFSNTDSENKLTNAGKHSKLGELIAATIIEAIPKAISKQVWITKKSQSNALVRLNRFKLDINEFYKELDCDKFEFIKQLRIDARKQDNVAITTSILNLIDEYENGLIQKHEAYELALKIKEESNSNPIKKILEYWINYFIR